MSVRKTIYQAVKLPKPEEYNEYYFDGAKHAYRHNAGYSTYERWYRFDGPNSLGEFWKDYARDLVEKYSLRGKKLLELGSAKGFLVEDLRSMGVNAWGLDVSKYAYSQASSEVKPYLKVADASYELANYRPGEFDVVLSRRFLVCIPENDLSNLALAANRIAKQQIHIIDEQLNSQYYLSHPIEWYSKFPFAPGTVFTANENKQKVIRK